MILKAIISGTIIALASELARRSPNLGGLIMSLPLISLLTFTWLWHETRNDELVAQLSDSIFWYFLPTLPMFVIFPLLLRAGHGFPMSLGLSVAATAFLYGAMMWLAPEGTLQG